MKKIIYTRPDGGLSVVHPVINTLPVAEDITEEQALQRAIDKLPLDELTGEVVAHQIVDESAIPTDRTFRNAWVAAAGAVTHDMAKAREIQKNTLRALRAPKLEALDVAYMRALEVGNTAAAAAIVVRKQALRDVTADPAIASARTPAELAAVVPAALVQS